jgi:hypothetical protein
MTMSSKLSWNTKNRGGHNLPTTRGTQIGHGINQQHAYKYQSINSKEQNQFANREKSRASSGRQSRLRGWQNADAKDGGDGAPARRCLTAGTGSSQFLARAAVVALERRAGASPPTLLFLSQFWRGPSPPQPAPQSPTSAPPAVSTPCPSCSIGGATHTLICCASLRAPARIPRYGRLDPTLGPSRE